MDGRPTWTDCDEAGDFVVPNVLSPRDLVFRPYNMDMDETVPHTKIDKQYFDLISMEFRKLIWCKNNPFCLKDEFHSFN